MGSVSVTEPAMDRMLSNSHPTSVSTQTLNQQSIELRLTDSKANRIPWTEVGRLLVTLEGLGHPAPGNRTWINHVSDISGFEQNQLNRIRRVVTFIEEQRRTGYVDFAHRLEGMRFSHSETIMRMHAHSPVEAISYASGERGELQYPALLATFRALRDASMDGKSKSSARRAMVMHEDRCADALRTGPWNGMGPGDRLMRLVRASSLCQPDFVLVRERPNGLGKHIDAVDCSPTIGWRTKWVAVMVRLSATATFFDRHWLVLDDDRNMDNMVAMRAKLNIPNLGFVLIEPGKSQDRFAIAKVVEPTAGPSPDRRDVWMSELSQAAVRQMAGNGGHVARPADD